jgi:amino acid transporter
MDGYVVLLGLLTTLFAFSGYDAGGHIAEETQNATKEAPRGILVTVVIAAILGFLYVLGLLFAIPAGNIHMVISGCTIANATLNETAICTSTADTGYALMNLFEYAIGPTGGFILTILITLNIFFAGIASVTVTARIGFAMARDGAFPGSEYLRKLDENTKSPVRIIFFVYVLGVTLMLLQLVNTAAFTAIVSLTTIGLQISYAIPIWMRITLARDTFVPSTFSLGRFSICMGWVAALWLTGTSCLFFWPFEYPITISNMNYTSAVVVPLAIIATVFWIVSARHWFKGPKPIISEVELY